MAFELSAKAEIYSKETNIQQQIILEIDGISTIFGAVQVLKKVLVGDDGLVIGNTWVIGGNIEYPGQKDYISLNKTSKSITQQLRQDKGATSSVSSIKIELIDKNNELTALLSPGNTLIDVLSAKANVYIGFAQGAHPDDSIEIFSGIVDDISFASGSVLLSVSHPEQLKRQEIYQQASSNLNGSITNSDTTISLISTANLIIPNDSGYVGTYIRVDDEIIGYSGISGNDLTGCSRGQLKTTASSHSNNADITSFYTLSGGAVDLALTTMISGSGVYADSVDISNFVRLEGTNTEQNALFFSGVNIERKYGLVEGDLVTVVSASNGANNFTNREILTLDTTENGSYIVVDGAPLVEELATDALASFKSQYDVLPIGCGLGLSPDQVDVRQHLEKSNLYSSGFHDYALYIPDTVQGKGFIEEEIYFPSGMYSLPRKGRSSVGSTNPPLASDNTKSIGINDVISPESLKISRGINKNFYNAIVFKYEKGSIDDRFLKGRITVSATSNNRIKVGNRPLTIESNGIRAGSESIIDIQSRKFLDRYKFASESISVKVMYSTGFSIEVGDIVLFGDEDLKMSDITNGTRNFEPRLMEVTNKDFNINNGQIKLELTDTAFDTSGRFVSISPASKVGVGSTTTSIKLKKEFTTKGLERAKWEQYLNQNIMVRSDDFSVVGETKMVSFDPIDNTRVNISPALAFSPLENYIVEEPPFSAENQFWNRLHASLTPTVNVTGGSSGLVFSVDSVANLFVGATITVNDYNFTAKSEEVIITDITSLTITVDTDLGFTPTSGYFVNHIGFVSDQSDAYLFT